MLNEEEKIRVEQYVDNQMSDEERLLFQQKLNDEDIREEVKLQQTVGLAVKEIHQNILRKELKQILKREQSSSDIESASKVDRRVWYVAASIAAVIVISLIFVFKTKSTTAESLFLAYYRPYPAGTVTRGNDNAVEEDAFKIYRESKFQQASVTFEKLLKEQPEKYGVAYLQLLLGNCYLNLNKLNKASDCFKQASQSHDILIAQHAEWYYALTLIRDNKIEDANVVLDKIINSNSMYSNQAKIIITNDRDLQ